jgi:hypothetical protein
MKLPVLLGATALVLSFPTFAMGAMPEPPPMPPAQAQQIISQIPATDPPTPGAPQIVDAMKGKHPRLLFTADEITALKQQIGTDPILQKAYDGTKQWATIALIPSGPRPPVVADDTSALVKSLAQAPAMAYAYALDHDPAMKEKIITTLTNMMNTPYWADGKELDSNMGAACNEFMVGLLFDTVHDDLDPAMRAQLAANIFTHARRQYYLGHKQMLKFPGAGYWQADPQPNHRWYRDMGLAACVLSVADEPDIDAGYMLQSLKDEMDFVMKWYPPDGDCHEGAGYQSFGYLPIAAATEMMDRVLGTTYQKTTGIKNAASQQMYYWVPGRNSDISYGDDQNSVAAVFGNNDGAFFLGPHLTQDKNMQAALLRRVARSDHPASGKPPIYPWSLLAFYDPTVSGGDYKALPLYRLFPDMGSATMRDSWEDDAVVMTFKCGPYGGYRLNDYRMATPGEDGKPHYVNIAHDDPDANEFTLAIGNGFAFHPGVYSFVHKLTTQHNTLTVDDKGQLGEGDAFTQPTGALDMRTLSYLTGWKTGDNGRVIIEGEAGNAYRGMTGPELKAAHNEAAPAVLSKFRRTAIWMPGDYILILDDIASASGAHNLTWHADAPTGTTDNQGHNTTTTETGTQVGFQVVSDPPLTTAIVPVILDGRWGNVPVQQFQCSANTDTLKIACLIDPWKKTPDVKMTSSGGTVTLAVHSGTFDDTWTWQPATDSTTPSQITGTRGGAPLISLTPADKAPIPAE